jgi:Rrf2 family transcriptional regulator, iron-sulfur cluster assembly transcription factor
MKLSTKSRYGVRAVFDIAYHNQGRPTQARDIARRQEVPLRYLEQIFQELRRANLVEAKRGPRGGYFLARAPETITLGDVVRAVQGPIELVAPEDGDGDDGGHGAHAGDRARANRSKLVPASIWKELAQQIRACFDGVTIKDLCQRGEALGINRGDGQPHMYFI